LFLKSLLFDALAIMGTAKNTIIKIIKKALGFVIDYHIFANKNKNAIAQKLFKNIYMI
jgi:predicted ATP-binding protein involved in virulence